MADNTMTSDQKREELLAALLAPALWEEFARDMVAVQWPDLYEEARQGQALVRGALNGQGESVDWSGVEDRLREWAIAHATVLAGQLNEYSKSLILGGIERYLEDGGVGPIDSYLAPVAAASRVDVIAGDQHDTAFNVGIAKASKAAGIEQATWITSGLPNVCPLCRGNEGKQGSIDELLVERATIHNGTAIGCGCTISPYIEEKT